MMKRYALTTSIALALMVTGAKAQVTQEQVMQVLTNEGYNEIRVSRTLFGNSRIKAEGPNGERVIVLDKSGRVLRDRRDDHNGNDDHTASSGRSSGSTYSSRDVEEHRSGHGNDDHEDERDDERESGHDDGNDSHDGGNDSHDGGNDSHDGGNDSHDGGNDSHDGGNDSHDGGNDSHDDGNDSHDDGNDSHDDHEDDD